MSDKNIHVHQTFGDKLLVRFYGYVICGANTQAVADAVCAYLAGIDTGSRPGPARLESIKRNAATVVRVATMKAKAPRAAALKASKRAKAVAA